MSDKMMLVIFDLDGTLADDEHRRHLHHAGEYEAFHQACHLDSPNYPMLSMLDVVISSGVACEIWSGRSEATRDKTLRWFERHRAGRSLPVPLKMRPVGNQMPGAELKEQWLNEHYTRPTLVFEDLQSVVDMWRRNGICCAQVAVTVDTEGRW